MLVTSLQTVLHTPAYIIVLGNEKGGTGKTTTTMHLLTSFLYEGFKVGSIDIDARQATLSRYLENRKKYIEETRLPLLTSSHAVVKRSTLTLQSEAEKDETERFTDSLAALVENNHIVIVDTPGSDHHLSRLAHSFADLIITPINDSFLDLDVLGHIHKDSMQLVTPGVYSEMIWQARMQRAKRKQSANDWVVLRNRLANFDAKNKRLMTEALQSISSRLRCELHSGFTERVIYRELFLKGLTLFDIFSHNTGVKPGVSHVAARHEFRVFTQALGIEQRIQRKIEQTIALSAKGTEAAAKQAVLPVSPPEAANEVIEKKSSPVEEPLNTMLSVSPIPPMQITERISLEVLQSVKEALEMSHKAGRGEEEE